MCLHKEGFPDGTPYRQVDQGAHVCYEELTEYIGKHMVAHILTAEPPNDTAGGQLIGIDPEKKTASLRRYDNGEVREFRWSTTHFRYTTFIESPFTDLTVGEERRFESLDYQGDARGDSGHLHRHGSTEDAGGRLPVGCRP